MALQIIRNNIINVQADAIVNTANPAVAVGPGVDEAIYTAAGWDRLLEARAAIGPMKPGEVAHTPAFDLDAKYIIHAIGPAWRGGGYGERETVAACYSKSMKLAAQLGCESIAFPLMATGTYGFPKDEALRIAVREISSFLIDNEMEVFLVVYDKESFAVSGKLFSDIKAYIGDEDTAGSAERAGRAVRAVRRARGVGRMLLNESMPLREEKRVYSPQPGSGYETSEPIESGASVLEDAAGPELYKDAAMEPIADADICAANKSLIERLEHMDKTFQEYLLMLIDRKELKDPEVYKKANIDRKHFSKIRSNREYSPSKKTALALAIGLELSIDETRDLLLRAGLALSPSNTFDKIVEYCIENGYYDIHYINTILFDYDQPTLGA